jgi:hypothetical protein
MAVLTDVLNDALSEVGAGFISDPNEPSEQARRARFLFPRVFRAELRRNAWSFALKRDLLAATGNTPAFQFAYEYQLPVDFIRLWTIGDGYNEMVLDVGNSSDVSPYAIENRHILTNIGAPLPIRYVFDVSEDVNSWDSLFRDVIAIRLAMKLVPALSKSDSKFQLLAAEYKQAIKDAKRVNAIELPPQPRADDSWMVGRL